jgi:ankyrin repeat protein
MTCTTSSDIELRRGEGKWIDFTITRGGVALNLSGEEFLFAVKSNQDDAAYLLLKSGESFDPSNAASGELALNITAADTIALGVGNFVSALKIVFENNTDVDLSDNIPFIIRSSVFHD